MPVLKHDLDRDTKVATDASKKGIGAVLLQSHMEEWHPVAYASRSLTATEQRYAAIEKEALVLVFGCQKFEAYVYGKHITLVTDHKPLIAIRKKPLGDASPRIQRLMLKLLRYDFDLVWVPGKLMHIPDTLSRAYLIDTQVDSLEAEVAEHTEGVISSSE